jgi:hypothetical protein
MPVQKRAQIAPEAQERAIIGTTARLLSWSGENLAVSSEPQVARLKRQHSGARWPKDTEQKHGSS